MADIPVVVSPAASDSARPPAVGAGDGAGLGVPGRGVILGPCTWVGSWEELDNCPLPKPRPRDLEGMATQAAIIKKTASEAATTVRW
jgi:hypothetical protein